MTDQKKAAMKSWAWDELKKRLFGAAFLIAASILAWVFTPIGIRVSAVWQTPETLGKIESSLTSLDGKLSRLQADVSRLQLPSDIFEVSVANSGAVEGFCVELEPCNIRIKLRRLPAAVECQVVPGSVRWQFINPRTDAVSSARRIDAPQNRNIGSDWTFTDLQVMTPSGLSPISEFFFDLEYIDCEGTPAGLEPIRDTSARIPIPIFTERP